jgi:cell filamentation protein
VLINKFDVLDGEKLAQLEARITYMKAGLLLENPLPGNFDFAHYKAHHRFLFEDIYDWAGELRDIDISKQGTAFVAADQIEEIGNAIFKRLTDNHFYANAKPKRFKREMADLYHSINMLHPFREGNGRTQRAFFTALIRHLGYDISFGSIDKDLLMIATIHAAHGVMDFLVEIFEHEIHRA